MSSFLPTNSSGCCRMWHHCEVIGVFEVTVLLLVEGFDCKHGHVGFFLCILVFDEEKGG